MLPQQISFSLICNSHVDRGIRWIEALVIKIWSVVTQLSVAFYSFVLADATCLDIVLLLITISACIFYCVKKFEIRLNFELKSSSSSLLRKVREQTHRQLESSFSIKMENWQLAAASSSRKLLPIYLVLFGLSYLIVHSCLYFPDLMFFDSKTETYVLQNVSTTISSVGTILFALIIFIAELGRGEKGRYAVRVYLVRTNLLVLVSVCLSLFLILITRSVNVLILPMVGLLVLLTINSIFWIVRLSSSKAAMQKEIDRLFRRELIAHIESVIEVRFAQHQLKIFLKQNNNIIEYLPFIFDRESYTPISTSAYGVIEDINLRVMDRILKILSSSNPLRVDSIESNREQPLQSNTSSVNQNVAIAILTKSIGDLLNENDREVLFVKNRLLSREKTLEIERLIDLVFITSKHETYGSDELRAEFEDLRHQFITAIKASPSLSIDPYVLTYSNLINEYLTVLERYSVPDEGTNSDENSSQSCRTSSIEIGWLEDDIKKVLTFVLTNAENLNENTISSVLYLPITICKRALEHADNILLQIFISFLIFYVRLSYRIKDPELQEKIVECSIRHPRELSSYYLFPKLKKTQFSHPQKERLKNAAFYLLYTYCALAKEAYRNKDSNLFNRFISEIIRYGDTFNPSNDRWTAAALKSHLETTSSLEERGTLEKNLGGQIFIEGIEEKLKEQKAGILAGIGSVLLQTLVAKKEPEWTKSLEIILNVLPANFEKLFSAIQQANSMGSLEKDEVDFDFEVWQKKRSADSYWNQVDVYLSQLFCLKLLKTLNLQAPISFNKTDRRMAEWCSENGSLPMALNTIKLSPKKYPLSELEHSRISDLEQIFRQVCKTQENLEEKQMRESPLSSERVDDFCFNVAESFKETRTLREILEHFFKCYRNKINDVETQNVFSVGINRIDDKAIFLKNWHISYHDWGRVYGESVGFGEDAFLADNIIKRFSAEKREYKELSAILSTLEEPLIIVVNHSSYLLFQEAPFSFTPDYLLKDKALPKGFRGQLEYNGKKAPVFEVYVGTQGGGILVTDKNLKLTIEQFAPITTATDIRQIKFHEELGIEVVDLNLDDARREKILSKPPAWLQTISSEKSVQEEHLRARVQISAIERLRMTMGSGYGVWIPVKNELD